MKNTTVIEKIICLLFLAQLTIGATAHAAAIRCASTTSTQNSGLFEYLLPQFDKETGISVQVIAVGTGAALKIGQKGDVDVVFVHAKDKELEMVDQGWFIHRKEVMYNDFVLVGPGEDPALIGRADSAGAAFKRILAKKSLFVSRGDNSGTHMKEIKMWQHLGQLPQSVSDNWYLSVGQGMAKTLRIAAEKKAYTLTDRGTWYAMADKENLPLQLLFEKDPLLNNQYSIMMVNPAHHPHIKKKEAQQFINWLTTTSGQTAIANFRSPKGKVLFIPNAK